MPTCAIYARVSDESQVKGDSIEHQISFCREIARRRSKESDDPWITPDALVYVDEGITGTSLVKRSAVQRLIRDARARRFDVVLFKGISRFARDTVDALVMLRTLLACGVRVVSIEENFDSQRDNAEFVFTIHSALAQAESEKTAVRVRMGALQKAKQGKWNGQAPDGYLLNPETQRLEIDKTFAPVIREIFRRYVQGYGSRKIAAMLNEQGQLTKRGCLWTQRNISRILKNPVYVGDVAYGRRERRLEVPSDEDMLARRKKTVWVDNPDDVVVCRDAHPAIVDRATFENVAAIMAERRRKPGRSGDVHLLSRGLMKCRCGSSMVVKYNGRGTRYYRCLRQADCGRKACSQPFLRADEVEAAVLERVRADVSDVFEFDTIDMVRDPLEEMNAQLQEIERQIEKLVKASQMLFEQFAEGTVSKDQFGPLNQNFRERISRLRETARELTDAKNGVTPWAEIPSRLRDAMRELLSVRTSDIHVTRQLLERLVQTILVDRMELHIVYKFQSI
jgi:site-specific DNA recombinase